MKRGFLKSEKPSTAKPVTTTTKPAESGSASVVPVSKPSAPVFPNKNGLLNTDATAATMQADLAAAGNPGCIMEKHGWERSESPEKYASFGIMCYENLYKVLPSEWDPPPSSPAHFRIRSAGNKGLGMFATKDISPDELIHVERLAVAMPQFTPALGWDEAEDNMRRFLDAMKPDVKHRYLALSNCKPLTDGGPHLGIFRTNAMGVDMKQVQHIRTYGAIFVDMSRINHSCFPNARGLFDHNTLCLELRANFPISKGEEIFVSYTGLMQTREKRRHILMTNYKFTCTCHVCGPAPLLPNHGHSDHILPILDVD